MTDVEVDGEPIALLYLGVDDVSGVVTSVTHVEVIDGRDLGTQDPSQGGPSVQACPFEFGAKG